MLGWWLSENLASLHLPGDQTWSSIGVVPGQELHGGHQARIFAGAFGSERVVVILTVSRLVDQAYRRRVEMTSLLAEMDDSVVGPLTTGAGVVAELGQWLAVVYPFVAGRTPDVCEEADVRQWRQRWRACTTCFSNSIRSTCRQSLRWPQQKVRSHRTAGLNGPDRVARQFRQ